KFGWQVGAAEGASGAAGRACGTTERAALSNFGLTASDRTWPRSAPRAARGKAKSVITPRATASAKRRTPDRFSIDGMLLPLLRRLVVGLMSIATRGQPIRSRAV